MPHRLLAALVGLVLTAFAVSAVSAADAAPPRPHGWPGRFALGAADSPGGAAKLRARAPLQFRYQYLTGGLDTGRGWSSWNPDGSFVTMYVRESRAAHVTPVFSYYQLQPSSPGAGGAESEHDFRNLRDPALMRRYYADFELALRRSAAFPHTRVVMHIEPDLWGFMEQSRGDDARRVPAAVASSGDPLLRGLPDDAAGFAQALVRLRDRLAPNVVLAWHLSTWGVNRAPTDPTLTPRDWDALAARAARFYRSLGARFDIVFNDIADRDDGWRRRVNGERAPRDRYTAAAFRRHAAFIRGFTRRVHRAVVLWQLPLGNSHLPDTWRRYRDNRVQWFLGRRSRAHLRLERSAGVVALLFGAGAEGCTTPWTDGGLFFRLARRYLRHPLRV